jgi:hypothetical protein
MTRVNSYLRLVTVATFMTSILPTEDTIAENATFFQEAYVKASNTGREDYFGGSAISGDTIAVGAPGEHSSAMGIDGDQSDNSARFSGAVYVFAREDGLWTQQAYIKASNTDPIDTFGSAVALSGDTLAVGAVGESSSATGTAGDQSDNSADDAGAVYIFTRTNGVWSQQAYLKASNTDPLDQFGNSLALSGDTLAVGVGLEASSTSGIDGNQNDNSAPGSGAVYVFTRTAGVWTQQAYLKASNSDEGDYFGSSVALEGDTLVVGAEGEDSSATGANGNQTDDSAEDSGAVYIFTRSDGQWSQQTYLKASNTDAGDSFRSVVLSGDTLVVGAPGESSSAKGIDGDQTDNSAGAAGAAYVFTRKDGAWSQQAYIKASNTDAIDGFGGVLALSGDTLVVSALGESSNATGVNGDQADNSAYEAGAGYVFTRENGKWRQQAYLKASNTDTHDWFTPAAFSVNTIVAGAVYEGSDATGINGDQTDNSLYGAGATYIFRFDLSGIIFKDGFESQ